VATPLAGPATAAIPPAVPATPVIPAAPSPLPPGGLPVASPSTPIPTPAASLPIPAAKPFAINLAERVDFVPQYTFEWCVGASLQMARSIITGNRNETRLSQRRLWELARDRSSSPYGGANPRGWTAALNDLGLGRYRLVSLPTFEAAVATAARAIADTRRPVGLVMWAGRHAWVMTGFEASSDPRRDAAASVTRIRVMDPLYPHGSRWGPSPKPNRLIRLDTLGRQFVARPYRPDHDLGVDPGWLLVLPLD
jgi:hypothetical protein